MAQPANSIIGSAMFVHPSGHESQSSASRGRGRGRGSSSGGNQNRIYALAGRQDQESSPDILTGMLTICSHDVYALIDPGSTLSCITPFVVQKFGIVPEILSDHFALAACYAIVDYRVKTDRFHFLGEPVLEWVGNTATPRGRFISYLKARKMIAKGCIYHIVRVKDADVEIPTLQSILVLKEYMAIFLDELPGIPPEREIDFCIDLLPRTQPISIPLYRMAPAELKELKEQLKDLLEKAFLGHIVSDKGIKVNTQNIEAVKSWPRPTTPTEIRSFLGLAGYYRSFVEGFSSLSAPLTKLTQKATKFQWTEAYEQSFQELKNRLTSVPVLALPEGLDGYAMYCDASSVRLGCVLMQYGKVIVYDSR
ncbi:uncharacterized protein [Nicotiana sylvestris]|uniref:uncharacterized protein n=1 Tax=Nicotiana sylvestris TaxID=4096 RepID=UPI00388C5535